MEGSRPARISSFDDLRSEIASSYDDMSPQMRHIAQFALEHPNEVAFGTVAAIAEQADVQPSSLVRFAKLFGFDGYSQLQRLFRSRLIAGSASYKERVRALKEKRGSASGLLAEFIGSGMAALEHLGDSVRERDIARAVKILKSAREIYVVAQGRAFPVAAYVSYALMRFGRVNILLDNIGGTAKHYAALATKRDAMIAVSFEPYSPDTLRIVEQAKKSKVAIVAISDGPLSPLGKLASICFEVERDAGQPFRSLVAPMCLAQVLVLSLGEALTAETNGSPDNG